jgi:sulfonate transport system ATP-binding protein
MSATEKPASDDAVLALRDLRVDFGDSHTPASPVLRDVTLSIAPHESVCLIGRSGSGKSTLLRAAAGLLPRVAGTVTASARTVMGFQDSRLLPWLRVWKNVTLGLGLPKATAEATARTTLASVQLEEKAGAWPGELSGGQLQRVALARALVRAPQLLMLDEPFGALDSLTRMDMQDLLDRLHHDQGWALLMVTHDIAEAVRLSDRILVLGNGVITKEFRIDRSSLDARRRPAKYAQIEDEVRTALA